MFGLAWSEILIIGIVALVVVPPKDLPALMRSVGKWVGQMRRMAYDFQSQMSSALKEAEFDDLKKSVADLSKINPMADIQSELESATRPLTHLEGQMRSELSAIESDFNHGLQPIDGSHPTAPLMSGYDAKAEPDLSFVPPADPVAAASHDLEGFASRGAPMPLDPEVPGPVAAGLPRDGGPAPSDTGHASPDHAAPNHATPDHAPPATTPPDHPRQTLAAPQPELTADLPGVSRT